MDFDVILEEIGEFGKFQKTNYLLICLPVLFGAANSLSYVFTAGKPNYRCFVPECDYTDKPNYEENWVEHAVPGKISTSDYFITENCERYKPSNISDNLGNETCPAHWFTSDIMNCDKWVYDEHEYTIVQDWNLTCRENEWKLALVGTMHFAGIASGSGLFGLLADKYGRKKIFIFAIFMMSVTGILQALSYNYITFLIFAYLNAVGTSGVFPLAFIIGVEMVGKHKREMSGMVLNYFYAIGEAFVGLIAWLNGDWRVLQYLVSAPPILFVTYYWMIPESTRWLLAMKNKQKAFKIIRKAANVNGIELSERILTNFNENEENQNSSSEAFIKNQPREEILNTFKKLINSKTMLIRALILFYDWAINAFVYYGLSLNSVSLSGNKYLNFILVCLVEIPGYSLAWVAMNKIGRRLSLSGSLLLCGITCILSGIVSDKFVWIPITLFLIGKFAVTSSFGVIFVHTAEMLPTIIRSGGVGFMSTIARLGAMSAPFVPLLKSYMDALPLLVFGFSAFLGGLLTLFLPETLGQKLPETIEEAELIGQSRQENKVYTPPNFVKV